MICPPTSRPAELDGPTPEPRTDGFVAQTRSGFGFRRFRPFSTDGIINKVIICLYIKPNCLHGLCLCAKGGRVHVCIRALGWSHKREHAIVRVHTPVASGISSSVYHYKLAWSPGLCKHMTWFFIAPISQ